MTTYSIIVSSPDQPDIWQCLAIGRLQAEEGDSLILTLKDALGADIYDELHGVENDVLAGDTDSYVTGNSGDRYAWQLNEE